jgi:sugar phosphate isomerase/epimerase
MMNNEIAHGRRLSVSTWSLHRTLGDPALYGVDQQIPRESHGKGALTLLDLPGHLAEFGISTLEICHFHLPTLDSSYLQELRSALESANIELFSFLIDAGDITHPEHAEHDIDWISQWFDVASQLGARCVRVSAGHAAPSSASIEQSIKGLTTLADQAQESGLRLMTENWHNLLSTPDAVHTVLERLKGRLGLCFDFGNWDSRPEKYLQLESIAAYAESCHTKAHFDPPLELDRVDYERCLEITHQANFSGPYTLIYAGPDDNEWAGLSLEREVVNAYL